MDEFHLMNQSHYLEPPELATQKEERDKFRWFVDSGLLSNQLIFGHFIHADDAILQQTAKHGVAIVWNPLSNGRMASGVLTFQNISRWEFVWAWASMEKPAPILRIRSRTCALGCSLFATSMRTRRY